MIAGGIVISILSYAVIYAGVEEIRTGKKVKVADTLKPGYTPSDAAATYKNVTAGSVLGAPFKGKQNTGISAWWNPFSWGR